MSCNVNDPSWDDEMKWRVITVLPHLHVVVVANKDMHMQDIPREKGLLL
jgi:hypothetical protein